MEGFLIIPWISYDDHFSLTGKDDRTIDGTPLWNGDIKKGKIVFDNLPSGYHIKETPPFEIIETEYS